MNALPTVRENIVMAALTHTLIVYLLRCREQEESGYLPSHHWWMEKMNHFNASCQGLDADYIFDDQGHNRPIKAVIQAVFEELAPTACELGTTDHFRHLERHLFRSPRYLTERRLFRDTCSLKAIAASLVRELEEELTAY